MEEDSTKELSTNELLRMILTRLDSVETRLMSVETRLDSVENRLTTLEEKVDRRLMETRPIWESVLEQLKEVNIRLDKLEGDYKDTRRWFRESMKELLREQGDLNERLEKIEDIVLPRQ